LNLFIYVMCCIKSLFFHFKFESYIRRRLGTVELADQVEVLRILAKQLGFIDLNRVAIHGNFYLQHKIKF
jgi:dipeptidyl aminopeptidase/acylaminoacyl peptidase